MMRSFPVRWSIVPLAWVLVCACAFAGSDGDDGPPYKNTLRWSTASEVDNFGFDIFRADEEEGPFEQINETTIVGAGTTDVPTKYQYEDATIDPRRTYYYYVESISMSGDRERFTPVIRARPKVSDDGSDGDGAADSESKGGEASGGATLR